MCRPKVGAHAHRQPPALSLVPHTQSGAIPALSRVPRRAPHAELQEFNELEARHEEQQGYFARLERSKTLKCARAGHRWDRWEHQSRPPRPLTPCACHVLPAKRRRRSLDPRDLGGAAPPLSASSVPPMPLTPIPSLHRAPSPLVHRMSQASPVRRPAAAPSRGRASYVPTDWEQELRSLSLKVRGDGRNGKGHGCVHTHAQARGAHPARVRLHCLQKKGAATAVDKERTGPTSPSASSSSSRVHHPNHSEPHWWSHLDSGALNRPGAASGPAEAEQASAQDLRGSVKLDLPASLLQHPQQR